MSDRILVRYNTKFNDDPEKRTWRVLVNGKETLARKVHIEVACETITEPIESGEIKHHFFCSGQVSWDENHVATIREAHPN